MLVVDSSGWTGRRPQLWFTDSWWSKFLHRNSYWLRRVRCEGPCQQWFPKTLKLRHAMTMYHYEGKEDTRKDPNRRLGLCDDCHTEYQMFWDDMWAEARPGI